MSTTDEFQRIVVSEFDFLIREFGCTIERNVNYGREAYIVFKGKNLTVTVNYESGGEPWVKVKSSGDAKEVSLIRALHKSGIEMRVAADQSLKRLIEKQADLLRTWLSSDRARRNADAGYRPTKIKAGSYLAREVKYLNSKGFKLVKDSDGLWRFVK